MDHFLFQVGARYDIEYVGANLTIATLENARLIGSRSEPEGAGYEFETPKGGLMVLHRTQIPRAEPA